MSSTAVNTLEKLCYNEETARKAIELIYRLATTENDSKLEAYFTFVDLFQVVLAETSIDLESRFTILEKLQQNGLTKTIVNALERGLKSFGFIGHIHSGDDNLIAKQYRPSNKEIIEYQQRIIIKLRDIAFSNEEGLGSLAKDSLCSRLSEQLHYGQDELILESLVSIIQKENNLDQNLRNKLLEFTTKKAEVSAHLKVKINEILEKFQPKGIEEELKVNVINAPWIYENIEGENINISSQKAIELANRYVEEDIDWLVHLNLLLKGEQRQTFYFAESIALNGFDVQSILDKLNENYNLIPAEEQNSVFINGIVHGYKDNDITKHIISQLLSHSETEVHGIRQIRFLIPITKLDLDLIKPILQRSPEYLRNLEYIDLTHLNNEELKEVLSWIKDINYSFALQLLHEVLRKQNRWDELKEFVNSYLFVDNILQLKSFINSSLHIEDLIKKSIIEDPSEEKIKFLINQIIKGYDDFNSDSLLDRLTYFLLEEYWDLSWNIFGDYLIEENVRNFGLIMFLERFKFDNNKLFEWSEHNTEKYPAVAFQFMNIYVNREDGQLDWDPIAAKMVDLYGKQNELLKKLSSKLSNFTIHTYSAESLLKRRKIFIEKLTDHPFEEVTRFVQKEIEYLDFRIEEEKRFGENYELGR